MTTATISRVAQVVINIDHEDGCRTAWSISPSRKAQPALVEGTKGDASVWHEDAKHLQSLGFRINWSASFQTEYGLAWLYKDE